MRIVSTSALGVSLVIGIGAPLAVAEDAARVSVTLKDHKFSPTEPTAPSGKPIIIIEVTNRDSTPSEFEADSCASKRLFPVVDSHSDARAWARPRLPLSSTTTTRTRPRAS